MKTCFLLTFICLSFIACKKENSNRATCTTDLTGKWRMVSVKDNSTNTLSTKPSTINGNVDITFTSATAADALMNGVTPTNSINANYSADRNRALSVSSLSMTKVMETSWGKMFLDNIIYSQGYTFDNNGSLQINTASNKTLAFIRQ